MSRGVKGGTVIAEDVLDAEVHRDLIADPDGYRRHVSPCRRCAGETIHAHCFRERILRPASPQESSRTATIRLYYCPGCGAVFTVLPAFIARHLWREWETVEEVSTKNAEAPRTTRRRWLSRLGCSAARLVQAIFALGARLSRKLTELLRDVRTRRDLVDAVTSARSVPADAPFAGLAGWIHRLEAGIRLM